MTSVSTATDDWVAPRIPAQIPAWAGSEMIIEQIRRSAHHEQQQQDPPPLEGYRRFTHSAKWLLFWMCWAAAVQGMVVNGFVNTSITSIEKRFNFKSRTTGLIAGSYDIACLIVCVPMSYLGSRPGSSKPRWLGACLIIMALGSFVFVMPHFLVGPYDTDLNKGDDEKPITPLCNNSMSISDHCSNNSSESLDFSNYRYIFILGQVLQGVGAVPIYTIGVAFLDESVSTRMSSLYLGIFYAMAVVGPALGFGLGGQFLKYYVDTPYVDPEKLGVTPSSNRWIGAWWVGFFLSGTAAMLVAIPILMTPPVIPKQKETAEEKAANESVQKSDNLDVVGATAFQQLDGFSGASKKLLKNVSYLALSMAESTEGFVLSGLAAFMPKIIESQFNQSASFSAMLVGAVAIPAGGGGTFLGGWIIKRFKMSPVAVLKFCLAVSIMNMFVGFFLLQYCHNDGFAGVNMQYQSKSTPPLLPNLLSSCNSECGCDGVSYNPVCGANGIIYYSPCHAGCTDSSILDGEKEMFSDCSCVAASGIGPPTNITGLSSLSPDQAVVDVCPSGCNKLIPFLIVLLFLMFLTFFISMPNVSATLRCVDEEHRGLALGLQGIAFRMIGTIPGPILFGIAIDNSCDLWQETCGNEGACVSYDNYYQSRYILALVFAGKILASISFALAWWTHIPRNDEITSKTTSTGGNTLQHTGYDNPVLDVR